LGVVVFSAGSASRRTPTGAKSSRNAGDIIPERLRAESARWAGAQPIPASFPTLIKGTAATVRNRSPTFIGQELGIRIFSAKLLILLALPRGLETLFSP
jgi:hypothetical protein